MKGQGGERSEMSIREKESRKEGGREDMELGGEERRVRKKHLEAREHGK